MGLFGPEISARELQHVKTTLRQVQDTAHLVNTTIKPDVFFKRLNFLLDLFLMLKPYEKYGIFKGSSPSQDYNQVITKMEYTVNDFIERSYSAAKEKALTYKTAKAGINYLKKYSSSMIDTFNSANTIWLGNSGCPHYTGMLYTPNNLAKLKRIREEIGQINN